MLYSLASQLQAPPRLGHSAPQGVARTAILFMVLVSRLGVAINYWAPKQAFDYLTAAVTFIGILIWLTILYTHARLSSLLGQLLLAMTGSCYAFARRAAAGVHVDEAARTQAMSAANSSRSA
jgi:AAT family amino acid transporter